MKIPRTDPRAAHLSSNREVEREGLAVFVAGKHRWVLATTRSDGRPQMSLVTGGMMADGRLAVATYPERAKVANVRNDARVSVLIMGEQFNDEWIQVDGVATVVDMPDAADVLVEYFRCISGEHSDWDEYRAAMADQGKCAIVIDVERWSPISKGGFPPSLFADD